MTKFGIYKCLIELLMTSVLVSVFPFPNQLKVKLIILYVLMQFMAGRYKGKSLLIWNELKTMFLGYIGYFLSGLLLLNYNKFPWKTFWAFLIYIIIHSLLNLVISRYTHVLLWDKVKQNILIIGVDENAQQLYDVCKTNRFSLHDVKAFINCNDDPFFHSVHQNVGVCNEIPTYPLKDLEKIIRQDKIDTVLIAIPKMSRIDQKNLITRIENLVPNIKYLAMTESLITFDTKIDDFDGLLMISTSQGVIRPEERFLKRMIDIMAGLAGCCALLPLTLYVYILNRKQGDKDPILFKQQRIGKDGEEFTIYKYRTMVPNAEAILDELMAADPKIRQEYQENKKLKDDPRITKAGKFLRKTSLDEFPQFINVLKGDMSLIGPRPYLPREKVDMGHYYENVVSSKPGITGMWQTHGRSDVNFERRLELDEYYYRNWSLWLDITLFIRTIKQMLGKEDAGAM